MIQLVELGAKTSHHFLLLSSSGSLLYQILYILLSLNIIDKMKLLGQ